MLSRWPLAPSFTSRQVADKSRRFDIQLNIQPAFANVKFDRQNVSDINSCYVARTFGESSNALRARNSSSSK